MAKILFIDDDPLVLRLGCLQLERLGHVATGAADAKVARQLLTGDSIFDLVVTDCNMPGDMDGFQLALWLRKRSPNTPILMITGYTAAEMQANAKNIPILRKPYTLDQLAHHIDELL